MAILSPISEALLRFNQLNRREIIASSVPERRGHSPSFAQGPERMRRIGADHAIINRIAAEAPLS
jgi:hypothetical protein